MPTRPSMPIVCAAERTFFIRSFACLKEIIEHPLLQEEEKFFWVWLCYQSTNNKSFPFPYSYSYEQMSLAVNKSTKKIHRFLLRLMLMGFLENGSIPICYGQPTIEMVHEKRILKLILPPKPFPVRPQPSVFAPPLRNIQRNETPTH